MAIFVSGGSDVFDAMAFGQRNMNTVAYLENQINAASQYFQAAGQDFFQRSRQVFDQFNGSEALRLAKSALRTIQHAFDSDCVTYLYDLASIQQAQPVMQRWVMVMPEVRQYYHAQQCEGYSDTYVDSDPGVSGVMHADWRLVNDGVVQMLPEDDPSGAEFKYQVFYEQADDGSVLSTAEKMDILATWDVVAKLIKRGKEDPTSPYCNQM